MFLCLKLGIKYFLMTNFRYKVYRVFLNLVFYTSFSVIFGILKARDYKGDREGIPHIHPIP